MDDHVNSDINYHTYSSIVRSSTSLVKCEQFLPSAHLMILIASGMFLWVIYGLIRSDPVIIGTNASGFVLNITLLAMKLRYDKIHDSTINVQ